MKKVKERFENAVEAFFEDPRVKNEEIKNYETPYIAETPNVVEETSRGKTILRALRQVLLYLPGTFGLWFATGALVFHLVAQTGYSFGKWEYSFLFVSLLCVTIGLGDLRKAKDYIPAALITGYGVLFGIAVGLSPSLKKFLIDDMNFLYIFPLALMLPFIAKLWTERVETGE